MRKYLQNKFALSERGASDLVRASIACTLSNIGLMFPMGILTIFLANLFAPVLALAPGIISPSAGRAAVNTGNVAQDIAVGVIVLALIFGLTYHQYNATFLSSYQESAGMRIRIAEKLRKLPLAFFGQRDLADLTTTIMSDCAFMETALSHFIPELIGAFCSTVLIGIVMMIFNWKLGIAMLWVVPVSFGIAVSVRPVVDRAERRQKAKKLSASDGIQECIETISDIRANNMQNRYLKALDAKLDAAEDATRKTEFINGILVTATQMILKIGVATTVLAGAHMLADGSLELLTFLIFMIAATRIYGPLTGCLENLSAVFSALLVVERMKEIENQPVQSGEKAMKNRGYDVVFDHVGFAYQDGKTVLRDVSFSAKQGQITALVGPSGGGKSTTAKLVARFWDATSGTITIGGQKISEIDPETLLKQVSIVFQDVMLFNNTIMENIRIGRSSATDEEVMAAARIAHCEEFIKRLPDGYQTVIGENGSELSGGERQRLSIARALLKDAPIILMDEATASLDVENESLVQQAVSELVKDKTVLIIAHRMRTVATADQIVVLKDGVVAESGTPEALMEQKGIFRHMTELQRASQKWSCTN
ncbi:ABC transporter ATP-binding protein [Brotaphodocola sp.]|uniref:ABC transporter ATP-binding protein n=1 Tax=Brotaphodocola sp. TaxID=3073577 RepID=UPI003D7E9C85